MEEWLFGLPVVWLAVVIFTATGLVTYGIHAAIGRLARGEWARVFKGVSPGMLPPLGVVFGLFCRIRRLPSLG